MKAKTFPLKGISDEDVILLLNLQGIVNREGARLFFDAESRNDWGPADRKWMEVWSERKEFSFEPVESLDDLVAEFAGDIAGLVVFDPEVDASRYVALTIAGIESYLAVSPSQIEGEIAKITVKEDLRGKFATSVEAYEWAIKNLRPKCSDKIAYSAGQSHDDVNLGHDNGIILAIDYGIAHKGFVFNLSPCPEPATYDFEKEQVKGHPEDARLMDKIFDTYAPPAKIYGWNEPEWPFTSRISKHGHMLVCGRGSNLSFHQHVPCDKKSFKQAAETNPKPPPIEEKYYLAFMTNEGDTPRVITTFMFGGWLNEERGEFPINWGFPPSLLMDFPAIAEYYYSTATSNDYFYAGVSGTGYSFVDQLPDIKVFADYGKPHFEATDIDIVDAWDEFEFHPELYVTYSDRAGIKFFTLLPRGESGPRLLENGVPVFIPHDKVHYKETGFDDRMAALKAITEEVKPPFLIPLYGGLKKTCCGDFKKIIEALDPEKFAVISVGDMAWMAKEMAEKG